MAAGGGRYNFEFLQWPNFRIYNRLVTSYNDRLLTYQTDVIKAFSAILNSLSLSFPGGFCHGMPEFYFDFALLWKPNYPTKRRRGPFPSWSWIHEEEEFDLEVAIEITPMVTWYKTSRQTGERCWMIHSNVSSREDLIQGETCEVIIISAGSARRDEIDLAKVWLPEWKSIDEIKELALYEFYNVLWIERKGDVAYRKALGRVWKEAWHRQDVEEIDVVLG
ncbi:hypothetical protein NA57DRAFT_79709 [Rhizodiscina lignyota]|uniref:Uncharacterized protein n=1 Tax=Rhizodiscina lignyota TaxID=1504668 RepID=A0A9P4IBH0_9PEZI|nr:hypothetical protein NA57DRAFT_79709 [Rhizodiscina lignyota]